MKLTDEQRAAFDVWIEGELDRRLSSLEVDQMRDAWAAGIAYAQAWRPMETAPKDREILVRHTDGRVLHATRDVHERAWSGVLCGLTYRDDDWQFTGWLPLPKE